jgi:hypothetical protein
MVGGVVVDLLIPPTPAPPGTTETFWASVNIRIHVISKEQKSIDVTVSFV